MLNHMLDQIQHIMGGVGQVADSIEQDVRTPMTRLRWGLEHLREADEDNRRELLDQALADADGLLDTFQALLRIAEVESGSRKRFSRVDPARLVQDVGELYEPLAAAREQTLNVESGEMPPVHGDRDLLFQALTNLVDNAVKYAPIGGTIRLAVQRAGDRIELMVADSGPGIPADQREAVLQRFVRLESSRGSPGSGLGLSLVNAVARLHDGEVLLEDNEPGLRVRLRLPVE
jgi:signal transduction histidine kinase